MLDRDRNDVTGSLLLDRFPGVRLRRVYRPEQNIYIVSYRQGSYDDEALSIQYIFKKNSSRLFFE